MTRLRDHVRTAFDREQARLGDVGDARNRLMHGAMVNRDASAARGWQWAAGVAAVLIAAIVVTTFALVKANTHGTNVPAATPSPKAQVSPTPLRNALNVPDSTPIVTFGDPAKTEQVDGITWDGTTSGVLGGQLLGTPNPAANLFATATDISDRSGRTLVSGTFGAKYFGGMWADDNLHFCQIVPFDAIGSSGLNTTLQLVSTDGKARNVAKVGSIGENTSITVAACSVLMDRAVVVQNSLMGTAAKYWVLQLSTGRTLWSRDFDSTNSAAVVASRDGMYVAEQLVPSGPSGSNVYGADGKKVGQITGRIESFSWDASLAVVDDGYGSSPVKLIAWRDGTVVWTAPAGYALQQAKAEPGGAEMAVWVVPTAQLTSQVPIGDLFLVSASGRVVVHIVNTP